MVGVLQGLKVVEFTHMVAGPACGQVLGDFGADITKVEPPQGDITRRIGPMAGDMAALYASTNRNKKVVCIDITDPAGASKARELALRADVVISNLDTAMLKRAGLNAASLREDNPRLICVEITGFGQGGPAGTDGLAQAAMGLMATTGAVEGPTFRTGPSVVDVSTGVWAALGVMAALQNLRISGQGDFIQASLADVCLYMQYPHITMYGAAPDVVRRNGNHSVVSCTPKLETADGMIQVTILHQRHWQALCEKAGAPELASDPRFASNDQRCEAQGTIEQLLNPLMRKRPRQEWVELLRAAKLPCGPERDYSEVTVDADLHARGMLYRLPSGNGDSLQVRMPLEFATTPRVAPQAPPPLSAAPE
jgi:crotonobetainyl-CoA:carnitine CoA-transferase CaiB-like acyl-CoA transferase